MNLQYLAAVMTQAVRDDGKNLQALKKALIDNDYKLCGMGALLMLSEMSDMGMPNDAKAYWETLALTHLPYNPHKALKK